MATSGSTDFSMNARAVLKYALEKIVVIAPDEEPSAADMQSCKTDLNLMLKSWQKSAPSLFRKAIGSVTLVANTTAYTLSPRPFRVISARYRSSDSRDLPMTEWTAEEYEDMPVKTSTGIPTAFYVDYQRDSVILNIWQPLAAVTTETVRYLYQRRFEDVDALEDDLDVPQEHLELVGYNLANRIAAQYGKAGSATHTEVKGMAAYLLQEAMAAEREAVVRFEPAR